MWLEVLYQTANRSCFPSLAVARPVACLMSCHGVDSRWHVQGNYENGAAYTFILLITFWILYSYLVPISLFVTLEIVKFWQVLSRSSLL